MEERMAVVVRHQFEVVARKKVRGAGPFVRFAVRTRSTGKKKVRPQIQNYYTFRGVVEGVLDEICGTGAGILVLDGKDLSGVSVHISESYRLPDNFQNRLAFSVDAAFALAESSMTMAKV